MTEVVSILQLVEKIGSSISPFNTFFLLVGLWFVLKRTGTLATGTTKAVEGTTNVLSIQVSSLTLAIGELRSAIKEFGHEVMELRLDHARLDERVKSLEDSE